MLVMYVLGIIEGHHSREVILAAYAERPRSPPSRASPDKPGCIGRRVGEGLAAAVL
jgi:hypothetical protein